MEIESLSTDGAKGCLQELERADKRSRAFNAVVKLDRNRPCFLARSADSVAIIAQPLYVERVFRKRGDQAARKLSMEGGKPHFVAIRFRLSDFPIFRFRTPFEFVPHAST